MADTAAGRAAADAAASFGPAPGGDGIGLAAVVGHAAAREFLTARGAAGVLPHALFLHGPRGVGKRTVAQALAAQHFCRERRGCGRCPDCGALSRGNHPGFVAVVVPPGKSAIPIDAVKELERELSLRSADERGRIVLIRGADRMTPPAQDALLKTLEEPPPGNVLLLTAERPDAVLPTIRSRCQRLALGPLTDAELETVARRLGLTLTVPVRAAMGCPGELTALADPQVDRLRRGVLKLMGEERSRADLARLIALLHDGLGKDPEPSELRARARLLLRWIASFARDLSVLRVGGGSDIVRNLDQLERLQALAGHSGTMVRHDPGDRPVQMDGEGDAQGERGGSDRLTGQAFGPADAFSLLTRLARAHDRIDGNVDPASVLFGVLHPAAEDGALFTSS